MCCHYSCTMCLCNAVYVWGGNLGTFKFLGSEVTLKEEGMGENRRFKKKNARGRCLLQVGNNKTDQQQPEQQSYKHYLNLSQGTRRDLPSWQCIGDISRCEYLCCLVNDNEVGVVLKVLCAA